ncbi:MAG: PEP/pyruvate-binding domain-containing protein [Deltaproteobacteria bacterium]
MRGWLKRQWRKLEERRQQKAGEYLQLLKVRYHLFRAILDSNHHAVSLITGLEVKLTDPFLAPSLLGPQISDLIETTGQMVEKMIRLGGDRYQGLTGMHQKVAVRIKTLLEELPSANGLPLCLPLDQVDLRLRSAVGGKAAALAHLRAKGLYGVPDGFVVPVHACRFFLEQEDLSRRLLKGLAQHLRASAEIPAQVIRETAEEILAAPLPADLEVALLAAGRAHLSEGGPGLAVRSSAIAEDGIEHSFAGQYTTILNVTTEAELVTSFKKVVASSFSARSIAYRLHAGLDPLAFDMAVLCLRMIPARASGILLTRDPTSPQADHMLISAVFGLGEPAVSGDAMTDLYHPSRDPQAGNEPPPQIARKDLRLLCRPEGGVTEAPVPPEQQEEPVLSPRQQETLRDWGLALEREQATPLDIEWAVDGENQLHLLQSRPLKVDSRAAGILVGATGPRKELLSGGIATSGGRATGKVFLARSRQDLDRLPDGPLILVMHRSMVDAARILNRIRGVAVDFGNPADHLSCVSREYAIPMLSGLGTVTDSLEEGQWVTIDAASGCIWQAEQEEIKAALRQGPPAGRPKAPAGIDEEKLEQLRNAIVKLNLTDAYGPTFSILECRSLHDLVRFIHEKAVTLFREHHRSGRGAPGRNRTQTEGAPFRNPLGSVPRPLAWGVRSAAPLGAAAGGRAPGHGRLALPGGPSRGTADRHAQLCHCFPGLFQPQRAHGFPLHHDRLRMQRHPGKQLHPVPLQGRRHRSRIATPAGALHHRGAAGAPFLHRYAGGPGQRRRGGGSRTGHCRQTDHARPPARLHPAARCRHGGRRGPSSGRPLLPGRRFPSLLAGRQSAGKDPDPVQRMMLKADPVSVRETSVISGHRCRSFAQARPPAIARYAGGSDRAKMRCL